MESSPPLSSPPLCVHKIEAAIKISWSDANPATRYYGCSLGPDGRCAFFQWIDARPTILQRNYIAKLKRERDEAREQLRIQTCLARQAKEEEEEAWGKAGDMTVLNHELEEELAALKSRRWWLEKMVTLAMLLLILLIVIVG
ncbi:uncharacterized protein LOC130988446 [Salvia miltiorrhiza]|uniref:uncharacterized protein LOC130988446 n=1 Tax=Salvia miltiorrhiza TaxID=226208 RepID=UPI0025AC208D|nr:uncharacterized protein LOC130988446 [Salvia miltiorrhiza]